MGKAQPYVEGKQREHETLCVDRFAPVCGCKSILDDAATIIDDGKAGKSEDANRDQDIGDMKELLVIGAGPHALALILRLLEPDAELMTEKDRHSRAEYIHRLKPLAKVRHHVARLAASKPPSNCKGRNKSVKSAKTKSAMNPLSSCTESSLDLSQVRKSILVLDQTVPMNSKYEGWMSQWKQNFDALQISVLRSPMSAHADPFDHRSLEFFAEKKGRRNELVSLPFLQRDSCFTGPFQAPTTRVFNDFHDALVNFYGIHDLVQQSTVVEQIIPKPPTAESNGDPYFEVHVKRICHQNLIKHENGHDAKHTKFVTKRVVCAMGPMFRTGEAFWEAKLRNQVENDIPLQRILHCHEIVPWLLTHSKEKCHVDAPLSILIVGGGITSTHLTLLAAKQAWCRSVKLITRSKPNVRQFDLESKWMGPHRGKLLDGFWSLTAQDRAKLLKEERRGGSVPPELLQHLNDVARSAPKPVQVDQEVQISHVSWTENHQFHVTLDDGSPSESFDMIWLSTGADNDVDLYPALAKLRLQDLPIDVVGGLPVIDKDLTWKKPEHNDKENELNEPQWKQQLRSRLFVMGTLAGLELGPDALNLLGARHGAVRIAQAIRQDMTTTCKSPSTDG